MIFLYLVFIIVFIIESHFIKDGLNDNYLDKKLTTTVNGLFVITIFFSHFKTYLIDTNMYDNCLVELLTTIGQLMVTSFLFYSGYGIYESIKNKTGYIKSFFKKRFTPTLVNFDLVIIIFIIFNLLLKHDYSLDKILLAFTGYHEIGNSNWYMFATFILYLFTMLSFSSFIKIKDIYRIFLVTFLTIIYAFIIIKVRPTYYADTILCFPLGMLYSYYKDKINSIIFKKYYVYLSLAVLLFVSCYYVNPYVHNIYFKNIYGMSFILLVVVLTMKFYFKNRIFYFFGIHTFWIYVLQRLPMIYFQNKLNNYIYFFICFSLTIIMSWLLKKLTDIFWKKVL